MYDGPDYTDNDNPHFDRRNHPRSGDVEATKLAGYSPKEHVGFKNVKEFKETCTTGRTKQMGLVLEHDERRDGLWKKGHPDKNRNALMYLNETPAPPLDIDTLDDNIAGDLTPMKHGSEPTRLIGKEMVPPIEETRVGTPLAADHPISVDPNQRYNRVGMPERTGVHKSIPASATT